MVWNGSLSTSALHCKGQVVDFQLHLNGVAIPFTEDPVRFLRLNVQVPNHNISISRLRAMMTAVDKNPLTRQQKLLVYSAGLCPRLTWPQELPISWVEREPDSLAARYIKRWAGLTRSANTAILYLPLSRGWLNLPRLSTIYRISRHTQLQTSCDGCVRFLADRCLK